MSEPEDDDAVGRAVMTPDPPEKDPAVALKNVLELLKPLSTIDRKSVIRAAMAFYEEPSSDGRYRD
jgi:hypothetical protein